MKALFLILSMLLTSAAFAQVKHIVFNIEGTLVQGIPKRNFDSFTNKDQMISVNEGKVLYYYIYPKISHLINYLQNRDQYVVHFLTNRSRQWADGILGAINLPAPIQDTLSAYLKDAPVNTLYTSENMVDGKFDLRKITSDLKNVIVITSFPDIVLPTQKANEFFIGKNLFYFEDYARAKAERDAADTSLKQNFPATEDEWFNETNKSSFIYQLLADAKAAESNNLLADFKALKVDQTRMTKTGSLVARYDFKSRILLFKMNAKKTAVTGCGIYSPLSDSFIEDKPLDDCLKNASLKYKFRFNTALSKAEACEVREEATDAYIKDSADFSLCLDGSNKLDYHWMGSKKTSCGAYLDLMFIKSVDNSLCGYTYILKKDGVLSIDFTFESDDGKFSILDSIKSLRPGSVFPSQIYDQYDSRSIGLSLIQWSRIRKNQTTMPPADYDFMGDTRIVMAFNYKNFSYIRKSGFLNQHETGTSNGALDRARRYRTESAMLNLYLEPSYGSIGKKAYKVLPKYSFLLLDKYRKDMGLNVVHSGYGNVHAVFKNYLKYRSTFTAGDSLNIAATEKDVNTFWYRSSNVLTLRNLYFETQIWGELELKEVDYFLVNCIESLNSAQIADIKSTGIPVYDCNATFDSGKGLPYNITKKNLL